jgi:hypothetical protein
MFCFRTCVLGQDIPKLFQDREGVAPCSQDIALLVYYSNTFVGGASPISFRMLGAALGRTHNI